MELGWDGMGRALLHACPLSLPALLVRSGSCSPLLLCLSAVPSCCVCCLFVLCLTEGSVLPLGSREAWEEQVSFLCSGWPGSPCRNT